MPTLGLLAILAVVVLTLLSLGLARAAQPGANPPPAAASGRPNPPAASPAPELTRAALEEKLVKLERAAPPKDLRPAAMCYKPAAPPTTAEYVCPKDGGRTQYTDDTNTVWMIGQDLPRARELAKALRGLGLDVALDESELCRRCSPEVKQPQLALIVTLPDGTARRTRGVRGEDLRLIKEFVEGATMHADARGAGESPLKNHLPRLRELLGLQP